MSARVTTRIHGGPGAVRADLDRFGGVADALNGAAAALRQASAQWTMLPSRLAHRAQQAPFCPKLNGTGAASPAAHAHVSLDYGMATARSRIHADDTTELATLLGTMADRIIRAYSLYSTAEGIAARLMNEGLQIAAECAPGPTALAFGALTLGNTVAGSVREGGFNPMYAVTGSWWAQEGLLAGLGSRLFTGGGPASVLAGIVSTDEVNDAAGSISAVSAPLNNALFGDAIDVRRIHPEKGIGGTSCIADALVNVHDMRLNDVEYGSIAIQRYRRDDGTTAWMVTVPGTDGHLDSPFSWQTNVELMSSDRRQRQAADSARMVDEAMRMAGIGPDEPVAIVGHSQGGIVAAVMASDFADRYDIRHIVTAGSPIANHPISEGTWVTSIEMNDELVSNLDGSRNPATPTWLTVRGHSEPMGSDTGTPVEDTDDRKFLTHDMNYMKAAWKDAEALGSPAVAAHEEHFRQTVNGTLMETSYYRGRLER